MQPRAGRGGRALRRSHERQPGAAHRREPPPRGPGQELRECLRPHAIHPPGHAAKPGRPPQVSPRATLRARRTEHTDHRRRHARDRPRHPPRLLRPLPSAEHATRLLFGLRARQHLRHTPAGRRRPRAPHPRESPLPGRLADALLRLRRRRDRGQRHPQPRPRDRPEARLGAASPGVFPRRHQPRRLRPHRPRARHRRQVCPHDRRLPPLRQPHLRQPSAHRRGDEEGAVFHHLP